MSFRMQLGVSGKKYGLQLPQVDEPVESFEEALAKDAERKRNSKKITNIYENALQEDPTAFDYDSVYDQINEQRKSEQDKKKEEAQKRQPRYIQAILDKTKERKREQDVIYDRKLQREKEAEGNLFGEKEKFVTAAYKKKLIEQKKWLEEEAKREEEERAQDVTKRSDLSDFYANLLTNNTAFGTAPSKQPPKTTSTPKSQPSTSSKPITTQTSTPTPKPQLPTQSESKVRIEQPKKEEENVSLEKKKQETPIIQKPEEEEEEDQSKRKANDKTDDQQPKMSRRNDEQAISEAKMRYMMRKAAREAEPKPSS